MKNRLHNKQAGIAVLAAILIISLADIFLRGAYFYENLKSTANFGEPIITAVFSVVLIVIALKGEDRLFYIFCGTWLGYFVLSQIFTLPTMITDSIVSVTESNIFGIIGNVGHTVSMIGIIAIGLLLAAYLNKGTICNKAFNTLCFATVAVLLFLALHGVNEALTYGRSYAILATFNELTHIAMVFLFTFFAYDSAKDQMKKTKA